jgi:hypothetical protein
MATQSEKTVGMFYEKDEDVYERMLEAMRVSLYY